MGGLNDTCCLLEGFCVVGSCMVVEADEKGGVAWCECICNNGDCGVAGKSKPYVLVVVCGSWRKVSHGCSSLCSTESGIVESIGMVIGSFIVAYRTIALGPSGKWGDAFEVLLHATVIGRTWLGVIKCD